MLLASPTVFVVDVLPQMAAIKLFAPRVSSSHPLPLCRAHQDQRLGLTQVSFKLLLLP